MSKRSTTFFERYKNVMNQYIGCICNRDLTMCKTCRKLFKTLLAEVSFFFYGGNVLKKIK